MKNRPFKRRVKRDKNSFNPKREYIKYAVNEFLNSGGKIKKIELNENNYRMFMMMHNDSDDVNQFLNGE